MNRVIAVAAAVLLWSTAAATSAAAQESASISAGIDAVIAGNDATTVSQIDSCIATEAGATFSVDFFAQNIPAREGIAGGLAGFAFNLLFDPAIVEVTAIESEFLLTSEGDSIPFGFIDSDASGGPERNPLPATTGNLRVDYGILDNYPGGSGVLSRLELRAIAPGETALRLIDIIDERASPSVFEAPPNTLAYPVGTVYNALVVVGGDCEAAEPTPYVPPSGGGPGSIEDLPDVPTLVPTSEPTLAPGDTPEELPHLAVDVLPAGNTPTSLAAVEACAAADVGDVFRVDIVIEDVRDLLAWEIALSYDRDVLMVTGREVDVFQEANAGSRVIDVSAETPDTSGRYVLGALDSADPPSPDSGDGVLARLTMEATGAGTSAVTMKKLDLDNDGNFDQGVFLRQADGGIIGDLEGDDTLFDGTVDDAEIRVDGSCPNDPEARAELISAAEDDDSDGGDGTTVWLLIPVVLAAIIVLGGGAAYLVRRRSG